MFSWITGPRITNVIEDLQPEDNYEPTIVDAPETPAHQFAMKAFKHALFGTPVAEDIVDDFKKAERKAKLVAANSKSEAIEFAVPKVDGVPGSPTKMPGGILMTPGTANKGRKTVSFGSQVVDNEGKRRNASKSGIPNDCPGKFPSPWTPGTQLKLDTPVSDRRPRTKLTEALLEARSAPQPTSGQIIKAKDDIDLTIDMSAPRSESGRYWKEQYETYASKSERELKMIVTKQQLAKKFAMKKDGEVIELATKLEHERKRFRQRERELEQQNKEYQERLRYALGESTSASMEVAALKARVASLERSVTCPASDGEHSKRSFQIYEESSKEFLDRKTTGAQRKDICTNPLPNISSLGKENASPRSRSIQRQSTSISTEMSSAVLQVGISRKEASVMLSKPSGSMVRSTEVNHSSVSSPKLLGKPSPSPRKIHKHSLSLAHMTLQSPAPIPLSSPLPMGSPDPWLDMAQSSIPQMGEMDMPGYSAEPFSRPEWHPPVRRHRPSSSVSNTKEHSNSHQKSTIAADMAEQNKGRILTKDELICGKSSQLKNVKPSAQNTGSKISIALQSPLDSQFDMSKNATHHAQGSSQVKTDKIDSLPIDRKEQARRRLEQRKRLKKHAAA